MGADRSMSLLAGDTPGQSVWLRRSLHGWAVLTVVMTFMLLALGSVVTTLRVGMADPIWPTYPWHLALIDWREPSRGFLIEHTHRLAGYVVGCCVIVLTLGLWAFEPRAWVRRLGVVALAAVIIQGLLGGFRVKLHALLGTDLAAIHGCFAQLVFALLTSIALFTSSWWLNPGTQHGSPVAIERLRRSTYLLVGLVYVQIIFGALVRHAFSALGQRAHMMVAFAVVAAVAWVFRQVVVERTGPAHLRAVCWALALLVVVQLLLGVETWISRFSSGVLPELQEATLEQGLLRTGHFLVGTVIFATSVLCALLSAHRETAPAAGEVAT